MRPNIFKTDSQYKKYCDCLNQIKIGDKVECLISKSYSASRFVKGNNIYYKFGGKDHRFDRIILPIIGLDDNVDHIYGFIPSVVGISPDNKILRGIGYSPRVGRYGIVKGCKLLMYMNISLDIIYTKIFKRAR